MSKKKEQYYIVYHFFSSISSLVFYQVSVYYSFIRTCQDKDLRPAYIAEVIDTSYAVYARSTML